MPLPLLRRGKVREVYAVDDETLLLVASDRVSAFDFVLREPIPLKGAVLTQMSAFWFRELSHIVPNHFITADTGEIVARIPVLERHIDQIESRSTLVHTTEPVLFECVVRGYLAGSAWKEYKESGTLAGEPLPPGLVESDRFEEPVFSPATKAAEGHDENIGFDQLRTEVGQTLAARLRDASLALYSSGRDFAAKAGIIIADTKFEFGVQRSGKLVLIDELLTPDSSRFWPADAYRPGAPQPSFDKQPLRDYLSELETSGKWNGNDPPPELPAEIVQATSDRYLDAFRRITGQSLHEAP
ncbi:MAG: phosphoribosylaminoimidazolesuccinocarboxamide synthase [Gemmatimonadales bacterium]